MAGDFASKSGNKDTVVEIDNLLALTKNDAEIVQPALAMPRRRWRACFLVWASLVRRWAR